MKDSTDKKDKPRERTAEEIAADIAQTKAETAKAEAETRKAAAEAAKTEHQANQAKAEAAAAGLALKKIGIAWDRDKEKRDRELAENNYHHIYNFEGPVGDSSVQSCIEELTYWNRSAPDCDIEIIFFSPGGGVIEGMMLFDFIQQLRTAGHNITTTCMGYAASMAGILLQAGDKRVMGRESYILIHEISAGASGKIGEIEDKVEFMKKIQNRVLEIFAARCKGSDAAKPLTKAAIARKWRRKDWWLDSTEALKHGLIDEIR
jgi:ATP-dependent Clp endopeptidase proteolytic subunit ClpP